MFSTYKLSNLIDKKGHTMINPSLISITQIPTLTSMLQRDPKPLAIDLETTGLQSRKDKIVTIQFGSEKKQYILDFRPYYNASEKERDEWREVLVALFSTCPTWIGHNLKFDFKFLWETLHVKLHSIVDTMLQEILLYGTETDLSFSLEETAKRYGIAISKEERKWYEGLDKRSDWLAPLPSQQIAYCATDVVVPLQVLKQQYPLLKDAELLQVAKLENACVIPVALMESNGCFIDKERWQEVIAQKEAAKGEIEKELQEELTGYIIGDMQREYEKGLETLKQWEEEKRNLEAALKERYQHLPLLSGVTWATFRKEGMKLWRERYPKPVKPKQVAPCINLASPKQVLTALQAMGIEVEGTGKADLKPYAYIPVVKKLLEWKETQKFLTSFGSSMLDLIEDDKRIHPNFNQLGTSTGRFSSTRPNFQQIPRDTQKVDIRKCIVGEGENMLLTADFSNIEARITADMSGDENMLTLFAEGGDLHSSTARMMFNLEEHVDPDKEYIQKGLSYRQAAKTLNFGLIYGMSPTALSLTLGVTKEVGQELYDSYFVAYPGVSTFMRELADFTLSTGYSLTLSGRRRYYYVPSKPAYDPDLYSFETYQHLRNEWKQCVGGIKRQACNSPIQGTSADITKYALVLLSTRLPDMVKIILCVHDEIVLEAPPMEVETAKSILASSMLEACNYFLKKVHVPEIDVIVRKYWSKK